MDKKVSLQDRFYGCIAASHLGSAMAAPVEGWSYARIEQKYGTLDKLLPYGGYGSSWKREPGTTEDGIERQKMMITAIIDKQDRVNAEDIKQVWIRDMNPKAPGQIAEPFDGVLLKMAQSNIPATDLGRYCDFSCLCSLARSSHPIGLINAGDIENAMEDIYEVGLLYQGKGSSGLRWGAVTSIGIAAATKPDATVDSVIGSILDNCDRRRVNHDPKLTGGIFDYCDPYIAKEIERGMKATEHCQDFREMRQAFDPLYGAYGVPYAQSFANEVVTKAVCVFCMVQGNPWEAIIAGVNMGRDTDCLTAIAAGLSGALSGGFSIPEDLIRQVDYAASINPYTNSKRTIREHSDGLYHAFAARMQRMKTYFETMQQIL